MRYYNENPQVTLWKEKCGKLKEENERLMDEVAHFELEALNLSKRFSVFFNSLPWYKKIFYKFRL